MDGRHENFSLVTSNLKFDFHLKKWCIFIMKVKICKSGITLLTSLALVISSLSVFAAPSYAAPSNSEKKAAERQITENVDSTMEFTTTRSGQVYFDIEKAKAAGADAETLEVGQLLNRLQRGTIGPGRRRDDLRHAPLGQLVRSRPRRRTRGGYTRLALPHARPLLRLPRILRVLVRPQFGLRHQEERIQDGRQGTCHGQRSQRVLHLFVLQSFQVDLN